MHESNELLKICRDVFPDLPDEAWDVDTEEDWYWKCDVDVGPYNYPHVLFRFGLRAVFEYDGDEPEDCGTTILVTGTRGNTVVTYDYFLGGQFKPSKVQHTLESLKSTLPDNFFRS